MIALTLVGLSVFFTAGTGLYRWMKAGDEVRCVANVFTFGFSTTLGHVLTWAGVLVVVVAVIMWARLRGH